MQPTSKPSMSPSKQPDSHPSMQPTCTPTTQPSCTPSSRPTSGPTTTAPTSTPSAGPTLGPQTSLPTNLGDTNKPTELPTSQPSFDVRDYANVSIVSDFNQTVHELSTRENALFFTAFYYKGIFLDRDEPCSDWKDYAANTLKLPFDNSEYVSMDYYSNAVDFATGTSKSVSYSCTDKAFVGEVVFALNTG
jgi:hypothetical protein